MNSEDALVPQIGAAAPAQVLFTFLSGRSAHTMRAYQRDLEDFRRFAGEPTRNAAVSRLLAAGHGSANLLALQYRAHLLERGLQPATVNRRIAALRSLVKLARLAGLVAWSLEVPPVRHEAYRDTRGPGREGFRRLLAALDADDSPRSRRDRALLRLLFDLGLRRGEAVALDTDDLDLQTGTLLVRGKGRYEKAALSLPEPTREVLAAWIAVRGALSGPLFVNFDRAHKGDGRLTADHVYKIVRGLGERAGIKAAPHGLRHTAITEACKAAQAAGIGLEEVLDFSRHKDVKVLMLYRDRERNVQGQLAALVAGAGAGQPDDSPPDLLENGREDADTVTGHNET